MVFILPADDDVQQEILEAAWSRGSTSVAMRRSLPGPGHGRLCFVIDRSRGNAGAVLALCLAYASRIFTAVDRRIRLTNVTLVEPTLAVEDVASHMKAIHRESLLLALNDRGMALTDAGSREALTAVRQARPDLAARLEALLRLLEPQVVRGPVGERLAVQQDLVRQALKLGLFPVDELAEWHQPPLDKPYLAGLLAHSPEASILSFDASRFPGLVGRPVEPHIHVFTDGRDRSLEVLTLNATGAEGMTGADLIYFNHQAKSLVFLQYKKLKDGVTRIDDRFRRQIHRLAQIEKLGASVQSLASRDWRFGGASFVKLAEAREFDSSTDRLIPGMYMPLPYIQALIEDPDVHGHRGGNVLGYENVERYWTATTFTTMVLEGWVGTSGVSIDQVLHLAADTVEAERDAVVAVETGELAPVTRRRGGRY